MPALPRHNPHALLCLEYIGRAVQPAAPSNPPAAIAPGEQPWPPLAHARLFAFVRSAHFLGLEWGTTWSFTSGFLPFSHVFKGRPSCGMNRNFVSLYGRIAFPCVDGSHFVDLFILLKGVLVVSTFWRL